MNELSINPVLDLNQLIADYSGSSILNFGKEQQNIAPISNELVELEKTIKQLIEVMELLDHQQSIFGVLSLKANRQSNLINWLAAVPERIQTGASNLKQAMNNYEYQINKHRDTLNELLSRIEPVKLAYQHEIQRLEAVIANGIQLISEGARDYTAFEQEQIDRLQRRLKSLQALNSTHIMTIQQIDNAKSVAIDSIQSANNMLDIKNKLWSQQIELNPSLFSADRTTDAEKRIESRERFASIIKTAAWVFICTTLILLALSCLYVMGISPDLVINSLDVPVLPLTGVAINSAAGAGMESTIADIEVLIKAIGAIAILFAMPLIFRRVIGGDGITLMLPIIAIPLILAAGAAISHNSENTGIPSNSQNYLYLKEYKAYMDGQRELLRLENGGREFAMSHKKVKQGLEAGLDARAKDKFTVSNDALYPMYLYLLSSSPMPNYFKALNDDIASAKEYRAIFARQGWIGLFILLLVLFADQQRIRRIKFFTPRLINPGSVNEKSV